MMHSTVYDNEIRFKSLVNNDDEINRHHSYSIKCTHATVSIVGLFSYYGRNVVSRLTNISGVVVPEAYWQIA